VRIEHIAIWTEDPERLKEFYRLYFGATLGEKYFNPTKNFESYFLSFETGCRLEIMRMPGISARDRDVLKQFQGLTHYAIAVGSIEKVNALTEQLRNAGHTIAGEPRTTGDGYYESVVLDPDGNRVEITV
jgi:lactoylglutathione lyase